MKLPIPSEMCPVCFIPDIYSVKANDLQHGKLLICKVIDIFDIKAAVFKQINTAAAFISPNDMLDHTFRKKSYEKQIPHKCRETLHLWGIYLLLQWQLGYQSVFKAPYKFDSSLLASPTAVTT